MDINQWILDVEHTVPTTESPAIALRSRTHHKGHRRRRSGESPIAGPIATHLCDSYDHSHVQSREELPSTTDSQSSNGSSSSLSSAGYRRKPRRRTKADKYAPERDRVSERKREEKKKSKKRSKRNLHKNHKNDHITGVIQGFRAKNVPKDRLTLDSRRVGLYTKGCSSAPIRGQGLPDLVFSEMKFLQNREVDRDHDRELLTKQKKKRKGRELSEEEISAYFVPDTERRDERTPHREEQRQCHPIRQSNSPRPQPHHCATAERMDDEKTATSSIHLPGKSFLGFGSRGSHPPVASRGAGSYPRGTMVSPSRSFHQRVEPLAIGQLQQITVSKQTLGDLFEDAKLGNHTMGCNLIDVPVNERSKRKTASARDAVAGPARPVQLSQPVNGDHQDTPSGNVGSTNFDAQSNRPVIVLKKFDVGEEDAYKAPLGEEKIDDVLASLSHDGRVGRPNVSRREDKDGSYVEITSSPLGKLLRDCEEVVRATTATSHQTSRPEQVWCSDYDHAGLQLWNGGNYQNQELNYEDVLQAEYVNEHVDCGGLDQWQTYSPDGAVRLVSDIPDSQVNVYDTDMLEHNYYPDDRGDVKLQEDQEDVYSVAEDDNFEEFAGFWRPNKLY